MGSAAMAHGKLEDSLDQTSEAPLTCAEHQHRFAHRLCRSQRALPLLDVLLAEIDVACSTDSL